MAELPLQHVSSELCLEKDRENEALSSLAPAIRTTGEVVDDDDEDPEVEALNAANVSEVVISDIF